LGASPDGETETFVAANGKRFTIRIAEIEHRVLSSQSVMPDNLEKTMTVSQLSDLLTLLESNE